MWQTDLGAAPERQSQLPALVLAATEETDLLRESVVAELLASAGLRSPGELAERVAELTTTEREVLRLFWSARSVSEAARLRGCSASTMEKQLENARAKLGCRSSPEAYLLLRIAELGRISDGPGLTTPPAPSFATGS